MFIWCSFLTTSLAKYQSKIKGVHVKNSDHVRPAYQLKVLTLKCRARSHRACRPSKFCYALLCYHSIWNFGTKKLVYGSLIWPGLSISSLERAMSTSNYWIDRTKRFSMTCSTNILQISLWYEKKMKRKRKRYIDLFMCKREWKPIILKLIMVVHEAR